MKRAPISPVPPSESSVDSEEEEKTETPKVEEAKQTPLGDSAVSQETETGEGDPNSTVLSSETTEVQQPSESPSQDTSITLSAATTGRTTDMGLFFTLSFSLSHSLSRSLSLFLFMTSQRELSTTSMFMTSQREVLYIKHVCDITEGGLVHQACL